MYIWLREFFWGERAYLTYWYAFLLSFPFSWRKVFIPSVTGGPFNEYTDISLYIGDILILSSLLLIIKHKYSIKSILNKLKMFHVEHALLTFLFSYLLLTFFWSESTWLWLDGIGSLLRVIGILLIFVFSLKDKNCSTWNNLKYFTFILAFTCILQSLIGIGQFVHNQSVGLNFLGESKIGEYIPGVAKIEFEDYKQIRAYGTFLHPNIFGGYLVVCILFIYAFIRYSRSKLFHVEQLYLYLAFLSGFLALLLTFSKGAIVSFILVFTIYLFHVEQVKTKKLFHVEQLIFISGIISLLFILFILGKDQILKSIEERLFLWDINIFSWQEILIGKGLGQSVYDLSSNYHLYSWQLQPIHNLYLYLINEIGLIGIGIIMYIIYQLIKIVPRGTKFYFSSLIIALGTLSMFDHYLWSTYTGHVLVGLSVGWLLVGSFLYIDKYNK